MSSRKFLRLSTSLALSLSVAFLSFIFINANVETWLDSIAKPNLFPGNYIFVLISVILIISSGVALYLAWLKKPINESPLKLLLIFIAPLILHIFWSFIFFYLKNIHLAFLGIILMVIVLFAMLIKFYLRDERTIYLLGPYLAWVIFIAYLNYRLWVLN